MVIGISVDKLADQQKFTEMAKLNYPLLADANKKVTREFGVLSPSGRAARSTFVIDKNGIVRKIYTKVKPGNHPDEVLKYLKEDLTGKSGK